MGLTERKVQTLPLVKYLALNPLFSITVLFLCMGHICTMLYWSLYLGGGLASSPFGAVTAHNHGNSLGETWWAGCPAYRRAASQE